MAISYTPDDLKAWLRTDPGFGAQWSFILDRMPKLGHTLEVERLIARDFDGTDDSAIVSSGARDKLQATEWARDAIREWAGNGATSNSLYFAKIARQWATDGPGKGHTAKSIGTTLDFLHLVSSGASNTSSFDMLSPSSSIGTIDVTNVLCWVYTDKFIALDPFTTLVHAAEIKGVEGCVPLGMQKGGPPGLDKKWWNSDGEGNPTGDSHEDQTHHFAGYFQFGAGNGVLKPAMHLALSRTHDWSISEQKILNKGDYDLGFMAAIWGSSYANRPRFIGKEVEKELLEG